MYWTETDLNQARQVFEDISTHIWKKIAYTHSLGHEAMEVGITADTIVTLLSERKKGVFGMDVYSRKGQNESKTGSDIDIFLQVDASSYIWIALQAKVLKKNQRYTTLRDGYTERNPSYQWEKLSELQRATGCIPFYLLYNGVNRFFYDGWDMTESRFREDQFGCSLVTIDVLKEFASNMNEGRENFINPQFLDIHPRHAQPWRILIDYTSKLKSLRTYSREELEQSNRNFTSTAPDKPEMRKMTHDIQDVFGEFSANANSITRRSRAVDWNPSHRIVIHKQ